MQGSPSMVKGVGFRSLSCRGSWVQIPPPAPFSLKGEAFLSRSYASSTGGTTKASIDGLTPGDAAYVHQAVSTTKYYEIQVTYSYDKVDDKTQIPVTFQFTPH